MMLNIEYRISWSSYVRFNSKVRNKVCLHGYNIVYHFYFITALTRYSVCISLKVCVLFTCSVTTLYMYCTSLICSCLCYMAVLHGINKSLFSVWDMYIKDTASMFYVEFQDYWYIILLDFAFIFTCFITIEYCIYLWGYVHIKTVWSNKVQLVWS